MFPAATEQDSTHAVSNGVDDKETNDLERKNQERPCILEHLPESARQKLSEYASGNFGTPYPFIRPGSSEFKLVTDEGGHSNLGEELFPPFYVEVKDREGTFAALKAEEWYSVELLDGINGNFLQIHLKSGEFYIYDMKRKCSAEIGNMAVLPHRRFAVEATAGSNEFRVHTDQAVLTAPYTWRRSFSQWSLNETDDDILISVPMAETDNPQSADEVYSKTEHTLKSYTEQERKLKFVTQLLAKELNVTYDGKLQKNLYCHSVGDCALVTMKKEGKFLRHIVKPSSTVGQ